MGAQRKASGKRPVPHGALSGTSPPPLLSFNPILEHGLSSSFYPHPYPPPHPTCIFLLHPVFPSSLCPSTPSCVPAPLSFPPPFFS